MSLHRSRPWRPTRSSATCQAGCGGFGAVTGGRFCAHGCETWRRGRGEPAVNRSSCATSCALDIGDEPIVAAMR